MKTILIIDDDEDIREIISYNLTKEGYTVIKAKDGPEGIKKAKKNIPSLIILDVMMPEMDGMEVCELLRADETTRDIKICFLTARSEDYSQIAGFDAGADDYVTKPVKPKVLASRINAILRRKSGSHQEDNAVQSGIVINRDKYELLKDGISIHLPRKEFELLALLASRPGDVFEREVILNNVWGSEIVVGDRTIDVHIRKLREKIGNDAIKTVKGVGYKFTA
jgi:two-component system alkaline phosphatase synthesis response regulator PhoP